MRLHRTIMTLALAAAAVSAHLKPGSLSIKGGETFQVGQKVLVTFVQSIGHNDGRFDFYLSKNGGTAWTEFEAHWQGPKGDGDTVKYTWTIPNSPTTTGQFRACQLAGGECVDANYILKSGNFSIVPAGSAVKPLAVSAGDGLGFDPETRALTAGFNLAAPGRVLIEAYDTQGRVLATLLDADRAAGAYEVTLFANRLQSVSGQVAFRMSVGGQSLTRTFTLP